MPFSTSTPKPQNKKEITSEEKNYDDIMNFLTQETKRILKDKMENFISDSCL
ncbi:DUF1708 domain-containing protein [Dolichospermum sp. ST_sed7]|nr:DUF1708 domain-containing protein [Dolichospermum sp. ST_sed7]